MPRGYFDKRRSIKSLIDYTRKTIKRIKEVIVKHELKAEEYRNIVFDKELIRICNQPTHPLFSEVTAIKNNAFYMWGETKYLLYQCKQDIMMISRRQRFYERMMVPLID